MIYNDPESGAILTSCRANYHAALIPIDFQLVMETMLSTLLATLCNDMSKKTDTKHLKLREQGLSMGKIAEALGCSKGAVHKVLSTNL